MKIICIIPARYLSSRLSGKALRLIAGKPMVQHVYEKVCQIKYFKDVIIATDNQLIFDAVYNFGGKAVMTSKEHSTGTDRLAEVALMYPEIDLIINVQCDEPLIDPSVIDKLVKEFINNNEITMATVMTKMLPEDYNNTNAVKVVTDLKNYALYFSRSLIPYERCIDKTSSVFLHLGIYAYKRAFLLKYATLLPSPLEKKESLEQLRALEYGYRIKVIYTDYHSVSVDSLEDLEKINLLLKSRRCQ